MLRKKNEETKKIEVQKQFLVTIEEIEQWQLIANNKLSRVGATKESTKKIKEQIETVDVRFIFCFQPHAGFYVLIFLMKV